MDTLASLVNAIGLALVRLVEKALPSVSALEDHAEQVGWVFVVVLGFVIVASALGLQRR